MELWLVGIVAILVATIGMLAYFSKKNPTVATIPVQTNQTDRQLEGAYAVKVNDLEAKQQYNQMQNELEAGEELTPDVNDQLQSMQTTLQQVKMKSYQQPTTVSPSNQQDQQMLLQQVKQMNQQAKQQQQQLYSQLQKNVQQVTQLLNSIDESVQSMDVLTTLTEQLEQTEQQLQQPSSESSN
ncbi:hypothetical protein [Halalkalibacter sp. APA_J-10(15)]|uniref:hypothetical protein n=1 Tax=unclassified Halalkalibacter TaxID=2893063 RepID=UPI001FF4F461|nr:hypothetical protein [Halalkalibacter sp. APA_J-10(15)]MCK0471576.1 hypothetical protein [Halalkalibacter sp. APA_J-10(15)]